MGSREIQSSLRDERRTFRYGTNRMVEISLRHELDDMAKKSLDEIIMKKELEKHRPIDNEEFTSRRLRPAFAPRRLQKKLKLQPVFHDELLKLKPKTPQFMLIPNIPPYNPLDKFGMPKEFTDDKIRTYPYTRENTITTEEMQRVKLSSMGVLPLRKSTDIAGLKVIMEGRPVTECRDPELDEIQEANQIEERAETPGTPDEPEMDIEFTDRPETPKKKPAILGSEGTSVKVSLAVRPPKQPHPATLKRKYRRGKSSRSLASSLKSAEILLPGKEVYGKYDTAIEDIDRDLENVQTAMGTQDQKDVQIPTAGEDGRKSSTLSDAAKSVHDMLEEARKIATPGAEPVHKIRKSPRKREMKKDAKKTKGEKGKGKKDEEGKDGSQRTERTVDEIIASLRSQSRTGHTQKQSEADRKIQEIMERVMSRSSGAPGEETVEERPDTVKDGKSGSTLTSLTQGSASTSQTRGSASAPQTRGSDTGKSYSVSTPLTRGSERSSYQPSPSPGAESVVSGQTGLFPL